MFRSNQPGLLGPGPYQLHQQQQQQQQQQRITSTRPTYQTNSSSSIYQYRPLITIPTQQNSLLGVPTAPLQQLQQRQSMNQYNVQQQLKRQFIPQQQHSNCNGNKIDSLKICIDSNRRNINQQQQQQQRVQQSHQLMQQQQQQQQLQNNNRNKQLIVIQPTNDISSCSSSSSTSITTNQSFKRSQSSSPLNDNKKLKTNETPNKNEQIKNDNDYINDDDDCIIPVECNLIAKTINKTKFKLDAYYCKYCSLILNDDTSIKQHLISNLHKNKSPN